MAEVLAFELFAKKVKRFSKKFKTLPDEILELADQLKINPKIGIPLGSNLFKIRLASESKGKGKSGGFRIITYFVDETKQLVYLVTIYDKSEEESISKQVLKQYLKEELS